MSDLQIAGVRQFNRTVVQRVGALEDHYLSADQSLGEARVLFEIGTTGEPHLEVGRLRSRLGLDSGYLSRLLRALERAELVVVGSSAADGRRRVVRLTSAGEKRLAQLESLSDGMVAGILDPLTGAQRDRLVNAMGEVERLLTASMVSIEVVDPESDDAVIALTAFAIELAERFPGGFDPSRSAPADADLFRAPDGAFLVGLLNGEPVACGALKTAAPGVGELKRMWVSGERRGLGLGRRMLAALERQAVERGLAQVRLETNGALTEALELYRSAGYEPIPRFGDDPYAEHWLAKTPAY